MLPIFIVNLPERGDRYLHTISEFRRNPHFNVKIINPIKNQKPAYSLWLTLKQITTDAMNDGEDFIIFCEDDHVFTDHYSFDFLTNCIKQASYLEADVLLGGISWFSGSIPISTDLFWVERFSGTQFVILFKKFYTTILQSSFDVSDTADRLISKLSGRKLVIHPFISKQKEFGYSDVTPLNNNSNRVETLFNLTEKKLSTLKTAWSYNRSVPSGINYPIDSSTVLLPLHLITKKRSHSSHSLLSIFEKYSEFDSEIIEMDNERMELWAYIRKSVEKAIINEDDFIIFCRENHSFTEAYTCDFFINSIVQAYVRRAEILFGGVDGFISPVRINQNLYWIDRFFSSQFFVILKDGFKKILSYDFRPRDNVNLILSALFVNKLVMCPFISVEDKMEPSISKSLTTKGYIGYRDAEAKLLSYNKALTEFDII